MNIAEIAKRMKYNGDGYDNIQGVYQELIGEYANIVWQEEPYRIMYHWVGSWCCTDTDVGYRIYCFDDMPVGFSVQTARKSDEKFYWFKDAPIKSMIEYLLSVEEHFYPELTFINPEDEYVGDGFSVCYNSEVYYNDKSKVFLNGVPVTILEFIENEGDSPYTKMLSQHVKIDYNGTEKIMKIQELTFPWYLNDEPNKESEED